MSGMVALGLGLGWALELELELGLLGPRWLRSPTFHMGESVVIPMNQLEDVDLWPYIPVWLLSDWLEG